MSVDNSVIAVGVYPFPLVMGNGHHSNFALLRDGELFRSSQNSPSGPKERGYPWLQSKQLGDSRDIAAYGRGIPAHASSDGGSLILAMRMGLWAPCKRDATSQPWQPLYWPRSVP